MAGGQVWIPVNASMRGFATTVAKEASKAAGAGGRELETGFRKGGEAAGQAAADGLAAQAKKVDAASRALSTARNAEVQAANDAAVAEEKLNQLRDSGNASTSDLIKAETALETAKAKAADAADRAAKREADLTTVRDGGDATSKQLIRAEDQLAAARVKQTDTMGKARAAEAALEDAKNDSAAAAARVEDATAALAAARDKYGDDSREAATAEKELARAQKDADKATMDVVKSSGQARKATSDLANAQDDARSKSMLLEGVQKDLASAEQRAGDEADEAGGKIRRMGDDMAGADGDTIDLTGSIIDLGKKAAVATVGISGIGAAFSTGMEGMSVIGDMNRQLGLTGDAAAALGDEVGDVLGTGLASNMEEAADAVGSLHAQFGYLGFEGEQTAAELSDNFLGFAKTFEVDMAEATQTAGQLVLNGLAPDVEAAADLMTSAMQRVPMAMRDELPEIINEYGVHFAGLGLSGEEAFGLLVDQADKGKWALDKTGDALKEFQIRASDGSTATMDAYEAMGLMGDEAEAMGISVAAGGDSARIALEKAAQGLLEIEDPAVRAQNAVALFGTPIEDLSIDQIPAFLEGLTDLDGGMGDVAGSSQELADSIADGPGARMNALKGTAMTLATDGFMWLWDVMQNKVVPAFQEVGDWIQRNQEWVGPLAAAIGGAATAWALWTGAVKTWQAVTKIATAVQATFNGVMAANPVMLVVIAIGALVAGLVYFFTQTETGQELWEKFTTALSDGWDWVVEKLSAGWDWLKENVFDPLWTFVSETVWPALQTAFEFISDAWSALADGLAWAYENVIQPVFDFFVTAGKVLFAVLATAVFAPLKIAWNLLSAAFQWGWENLIKPAWDAISSFATETLWPILDSVFGFIGNAWSGLSGGIQWAWENIILVAWSALQTAATWMWENVLSPVFGLIQTGWQILSDGISWYYENVIKRVWSLLETAATFMWQNVLQPVFGFIGTAWTALSDGIKWAYDNIIKPAWDALGDALNWLYDNVVRPVLQWMGDRWDDMSNVLDRGKTFIVDTVFGGLQRGLDVVKSAFELARDAIGRAWDGIKEKAAAPVKFVIDTVFNNGIVEVWNKVAGWVGLDPIDKYEPSWLGDYAHGTPTIVPGARSVNRDNMQFVSTDGRYGIGLAGGEGIAHQHVVDGVGGEGAWNRLNYIGRTRGPGAVQKELGSDKGNYTNYLGGFSQGGVIDSIVGLVNQYFPGMGISSTVRPGENNHHGWGEAVDVSNTGAGMPSTPEMQAVARFFYDNYAPMLAELIHWPLNGWQNIDEGQPFDFGPATNAGHTDHVHIASRNPLPPPGSPIDPIMVGSGGGGVVNWLRNRVADVIDSIFNPIGEMIPTGDGIIGGLPKAAFDKMTGAVSDFLRGKAGTSSGGVDTSGVVGSNLEIGEQLAAQVGWTGAEWEALKELWTLESNWNNHAQNPTSTAYGIPQFLDQTWATVGYQKTSDPATQIAAGIKYIQGRPDYGGLPSNALAAWWSRNPHWYDQGGEARGTGLLPKNTIRPERVLSPEQTEAFNDWMRGTPHGESAAVVARELASAFAGEDWGYGELASYIGDELASATIDVVKAIGRAERGFHDWARATEDQDRMGTPEEWAMHYGAQAATSLADDALGLFGLGGIVGQPLRGSLVDLINEAVPHANNALQPHRGLMDQFGVGAFYFGDLHADVLQPVALIDDEGRRIGTKIDTSTTEVDADAPDVDNADGDGPDVASAAPAVATTAPDTTPTTDTTGDGGGARTVIKLEGGKVYAAEDLVELNDRLDGVEFEVDALQASRTADIVSGVALVP